MKRRWIVLCGITALIGGIASFEVAVRTAPLPPALPPPTVPMILDRRGEVFAIPGTAQIRDARPVRLRDMGEWLPFATVAIEDHRFFHHNGVDWISTTGAVIRNARNLRVVSGASTITQQTVKILTNQKERSLEAKARESFAALRLEREWAKNRILETYLNLLDYGNRRIGAVAGAFAYFGKHPSALTLAEAIYLAGLPQSPTRLNPWRNPERALARYNLNVRRLARSGRLPDGANAAILLASPPRVTRNYPEVRAPHFARLALANARVPTGRISTTLDSQLQRTAENFLHSHLRSGARLGIGDAGIVVVDNATGEVRALASGGTEQHRTIDATTTPRSAGSTLKPFIYLAALDRRDVTAATLLPDTGDTPVYDDYDPQNYSRRSYGPVRLRNALGNSLNVPAVHVVSQLGARSAFDELRRWGFQFPGTFDDYGAGFILGNASIRLVDLAGAYAGLARGGLAWGVRFLPSQPIESRQVASPEATAIITDILCDNDARLLSFGTSSPLFLGERVAVKTGTSSGFRDRWCVGYTRTHTVAVWAGNLDGRTLGETLAVRAAAPLWAAMMRYLLLSGDSPLPSPVVSDSLVSREIDSLTGLLATESDSAVTEWFLQGTEPTLTSASMKTVIDQRERLVLPPEYAPWCASSENHLAAVARSPDLRILFPRDGATFAFNPHLPAKQQCIVPSATKPDIQWVLNGIPLADKSFPLAPGTHTLTASTGSSLASATFVVEQ